MGNSVFRAFDRFMERFFGGHVRFGPIVLYGANAMKFAVNIRGTPWGHVCFRPSTYFMGRWWRWYFYVSPNATPWAATFAVGPGVDARDRALAIIRRAYFGHNFDTDRYSVELQRLHDRCGF